MPDAGAEGSAEARDEKSFSSSAWWVNYERSAKSRKDRSDPPIGEAVPTETIVSVGTAVAKILTAADRCSAARDAMDEFIEPYKTRGHAGAALLHPAFKELVTRFASEFTVLTELVDPLQEGGQPWRSLIADARLLNALEAGCAAWQRQVEARAVKNA